MTIGAAVRSFVIGVGAGETKAHGSSFYSAMRLLPKPERTAMFAIYDFCREVDDVADEKGPTPEERRAQLDMWRRSVASLYTASPLPRIRNLAEPTRRYGLEQADLLAVIDGMEMDVYEPMRRPSFEVLDLYCDRVASAVGRLSVKVFGMEDAAGRELAHHLGRALQFTNILRDLDEDAAVGRLYLPEEAMAAAGIATHHHPVEALGRPNIDVACRWLAAKAHEHYQAADAIMAKRPAGRLRTPRLMSAVYRSILQTMEKTGWRAPRRRVAVSKRQLAWILATRGVRP